MNIILLGAPASGKGTQAEKLAKKLNLYLMQTGELSRRLAKKDKRIKEIVDSGKLIPEQEMTMYVIDFLKNQKPDLTNVLFEGFPRFISQYEALEKFLKLKGDDIDAVLSLDISKEEAVKRISSRRMCGKCGETFNILTKPPKKEGVCSKCNNKLVQREDDMPDPVVTRFEYFQDNTKELIDYLDEKGKLIRVDGERAVDVIFEDILKKLKKINAK